MAVYCAYIYIRLYTHKLMPPIANVPYSCIWKVGIQILLYRGEKHMAPSLGYRKRPTCPTEGIGRISDIPPILD